MGNPSNKRSFIDENGFYVSTPLGNSMFPFIRGGEDLAVIFPLKEKPKKFDVMLYERQDGEHVLHRIVKTAAEGYLVRGDNCYFEEFVTEEQIIGYLGKLFRNGNTKKDVLESGGYRTAVRLWVLAYPLRRCVHAIWKRMTRRVFSLHRKVKTLWEKRK